MIAIQNLQSTVAGLINAAPYFTAAPSVVAIQDDGTKEGEIAAQLRSKGAVVVVAPITRASRRDIGGKKLIFDCEVLVRLVVNPQVNAATGAAQRVMMEMAAAAVASVLNWTPTLGDRHFETSEEFLQLVIHDDGLLSYDLYFSKLATIN